MENEHQVSNILRRIDTLENQLGLIEVQLNNKDVKDSVLQEKFLSLEYQFTSMKTEVITTLNLHAEKTWSLIYKGMKIIIILVSIVCLMAGVKVLPEILKLGGM